MRKILAFLLGLGATALWAQEPAVISGKLLGYDGKVMVKANVHVIQLGQSDPIAAVEVGKDGNYEIRTEKTGHFILGFTGVNHLQTQIPLLLDKPIRATINVRLKPYEYNDDWSDLKIIGDFNNFSFQTGKPMTEQDDGTYTFETATAADQFAYQLIGLAKGNRSVNGTQSDDYVYDGGGDYRSVVKAQNGRVKVTFDPKKLARPPQPVEPQVEFTDKNSRLAQLYALDKESNARREKFMEAVQAHKKTGKDMAGFSHDWSAAAKELKQKITAQTDPALRQYLVISYLELGTMAAQNLIPEMAVRALEEIPPSSPLWSKTPQALFLAVNLSGQKEKSSAYVDSVLSQHSDANVNGPLLFMKLQEAHFKDDEANTKKYYDRLINEYSQTPYAMMAKSRFSPDRQIKIGKPVPAFAIAALNDPAVTYSTAGMKGKIYLIDFWAVWCGPCIAEMPNLHQAYEKFHGKNFEILSLSFDPKPEDVARFRQDKWKMPWLHAFVDGGFQSELARQFEVVGIPKPILVDANGTIIATEEDLRGPKLEQTLARVLNTGKTEQ
ncbi:redoxin domain-containing protein [candidate division KSB1 bacterium]|nr:redoxin domain-containing protein [candidate division KSB1 bacterium]